MLGLYIHVPFCTKRCPYCAFVLVEAPRADARFEEAIGRHLEAEAAARGRLPFASLYFGGGTPSLLEPATVARLLEKARTLFAPRDPIEVTLEANPEGLDPARWRDAGVTRLSLGIQSLDDGVLRFLGRTHDAAAGRAAFRAARAAGFANISVDLIFGAPGGRFEEELDEVIGWGPEHVSLYGLTVEPGTELARRKTALPGEEAQARHYEAAMDRLGAAGFRHYEISNFARPGFESVHNGGYWDGRPYLGFGPGAHSFVPHRRWANIANVERYLAGDRSAASVEELTPLQRMIERIFLGLRRDTGLDVAAFEAEFGVRFDERYAAALERLGDAVERSGDRLRLTRRGRLLADAVVAALS